MGYEVLNHDVTDAIDRAVEDENTSVPGPALDQAADRWRRVADLLDLMVALPVLDADSNVALARKVRLRGGSFNATVGAYTVDEESGLYLTALHEVAGHLRDLLFLNSRNFRTADRYENRSLFEFVPAAPFDELYEFVFPRVAQAYVDGVSTGWEKETAQFIDSWLTTLQKTAVLSVTDEDLARLPEIFAAEIVFGDPDVSIIPELNSTAARASLKEWRTTLELLRKWYSTTLEQASTKEAAREIEAIRGAVKSGAAEIGEESLASHFAALGDREHRQARTWSCVTGALGVVALILALAAVQGWFTEAVGWTSQLVRLGVALPVIAGLAYASKVSNDHRRQAWWAQTIAARLHTFTMYSFPLPDDAQVRLREEFGRYVFIDSAQAFTKDEKASPDTADTAAALGDLAAAVRSMTRSQN